MENVEERIVSHHLGLLALMTHADAAINRSSSRVEHREQKIGSTIRIRGSENAYFRAAISFVVISTWKERRLASKQAAYPLNYDLAREI